jgi:hypothetical protein
METRSGIKTTEFWISAIVAILGVVTPTLINFYGDQANFPEWAKGASVLAGAIMSVLAAMGYTVSRAVVKKTEIDAAARKKEADTELAISREDRRAGGTLTSLLVGVLLLLGPFLGGCASLVPPPYDPITLEQIGQTINFENADYTETKEALEACGDARALLEAEIRHESELIRLEAWKKAEEAKRTTESGTEGGDAS